MENNIYSYRIDSNIKFIIKKNVNLLVDFEKNTIYLPESDTYTLQLNIFRSLVKFFGYKCGLGRNIHASLSAPDVINFIASHYKEFNEIINTVIENFIKYQYIEEE